MFLRSNLAKQAYELLQQGDIEVLSLDIFDTIIYRLVPEPKDVFLLLARELKAKGLIADNTTDATFARYRMEAESDARDRQRVKTGENEITIEEIYRTFPKGYRAEGTSVQDFIKEEVETEKKLIRFDADIVNLIKYAHENKIKVVLVSDMYLQQSNIEYLLEGIIQYVDQVFMSTTHRTFKAEGLFDIAIEKLGVSPEKILHIGDNYEADVQPAVERNMNVLHWTVFQESFEEVLQKEYPFFLSKRGGSLNDNYGDFGLTSLRRRIPMHVPQNYSNEEAFYFNAGGQIIGPSLVSFCQWALEKCRKQGLKKIYCLMREGRIFKKIFDILQEGEANPIETVETFVSRKSLIKASLFHAKTEEIVDFILRPTPLTIVEAHQELGLTKEDLKGIPLGLDTVLDNKPVIREYIRSIVLKPKLRGRIIESAKEVRDNALKYFNSIADLENEKQIFVVDLGYNGSIQKFMQKIFHQDYPDIQTIGCYLLTNEAIADLMTVGGRAEGFLTDGGQPVDIAHTVSRSPEVLEQSLMPDCGSTKAYDDQGKPILKEYTMDAEQTKQIQIVQEGIYAFAQYWKQHQQDHLQEFSPQDLVRKHQKTLFRFITQPNEIEIEFFGSWQHDDNFAFDQKRSLIEPIEVGEKLPYMSVEQFASIHSNDLYWPFAAAGKISPKLQSSISHVFQREIEANQFDDQQYDFFLGLDRGDGFNEESLIYIPYTRSVAGRTLHRFQIDLEKHSLNRIAFVFLEQSTIFAIDQVDLIFRGIDGSEQELVFEDLLNNDQFTIEGFEVLRGNIVLSNSAEPSIIFNPNDKLTDFEGRLECSLYFSALPLINKGNQENVG